MHNLNNFISNNFCYNNDNDNDNDNNNNTKLPTLFIQYNKRERYQRLSLYEGICPNVTDLELILMRDENPSTQRKTFGVRVRLTETQPTYDLEARVEPGSQRWQVWLITTINPSRLPSMLEIRVQIGLMLA